MLLGGLGACPPENDFEKLKPLLLDVISAILTAIKPLFFLDNFIKLSFPQLTLFNIELYLGQKLQLL